MSKFQIVLYGIFIALAIVGVLIFVGVGNIGTDKSGIGNIVVWGTIDEKLIVDLFKNSIETSGFNSQKSTIKYIKKDKNTYENDFTEALASGSGPDLFLLQQDSIIRHRNKLFEISFDNLSEREFKDTFIEEGEMYLSSSGIIGLPFVIDPLVMYWNRDIFQTAGIANHPRYWDELFVLSPKITQRDLSSNITKSLVALGEFNNIENAKYILSALILQSGNKIVIPFENKYKSILNEALNYTSPPVVEALRFYTEFSNPIKSVYSWNRALPNSKQAFTSGDLAIYFGFASELPGIIRLNPNLNFDVSVLPQLRDSSTKITYGTINAFSIPKNSKNPKGALAVALLLTNKESIANLSEKSLLPPVRRDLLVDKPTDAVNSVFFDSALMSKSWFDPNNEETDGIFKRMIESVTSGRLQLAGAVSLANRELEALLKDR